MLQLLLKPLLGVAGQAVSGFLETKKAKAVAKLTEIKAVSALKEQQIAGKVSWEASAVDQMKGSWKDEFVLILVSAPVMLLIWSIFSNDPEIMAKVEMFFEYFNNMPFWYQALFIGVVSSIYGLKGAEIMKRPK